MRNWETSKLVEFFKREVSCYKEKHYYFGGLHITGVNTISNTHKELYGGGDPRRSGTVLFSYKKDNKEE